MRDLCRNISLSLTQIVSFLDVSKVNGILLEFSVDIEMLMTFHSIFCITWGIDVVESHYVWNVLTLTWFTIYEFWSTRNERQVTCFWKIREMIYLLSTRTWISTILYRVLLFFSSVKKCWSIRSFCSVVGICRLFIYDVSVQILRTSQSWAKYEIYRRSGLCVRRRFGIIFQSRDRVYDRSQLVLYCQFVPSHLSKLYQWSRHLLNLFLSQSALQK